MSKSKSTVVIADKFLCDDVEIGDYVKLTLPNLVWKVDTITGAGVGGDIDVPLVGLADAMSVQIDTRAISKDNLPRLMLPGDRALEARFRRQSLAPGGGVQLIDTKVFLTAMASGVTLGGVQRGAATDSNFTMSVKRIRWLDDGKELFVFAPGDETLRINGQDYSRYLQI